MAARSRALIDDRAIVPENDLCGLPEPLVPAGLDLRRLWWMKLDIGALQNSDFNQLTYDDSAWRAAVTLWMRAWHQPPAGSLPNSDRALCAFAGLGRDLRTWRKIKVLALYGFKLCADGRLYHGFLCEQALEAAEEMRSKQERRDRERERKASGRSCGIPTDADGLSAGIPVDADGLSVGIPQENRTQYSTEQDNTGQDETIRFGRASAPPSSQAVSVPPVSNGTQDRPRAEIHDPSTGIPADNPPASAGIPTDKPSANPSPPPKKPRAAAQGTRLPEDWTAPEDWLEWAAREEGMPIRAAIRQAQIFADYWRGRPGEGGRKVDWFATWKNWIRRSIDNESQNPKNGGNNVERSAYELFADIAFSTQEFADGNTGPDGCGWRTDRMESANIDHFRFAPHGER
ncbi:hypothetical protein CCP2SC5_1830002 [Azospirillaceae bacterium]